MSRRHSSSRRRNYGRRQHEVRERRPRAAEQQDGSGGPAVEEWQLTQLDEEGQSNEAADSRGGTAR